MVSRVLRLLSLATFAGAAAFAQAGAPAAAIPGGEPAFDFLLGKMALLEGSSRDAMAGFEQALKADPGDPYLHFEFASLLLRQAQFSPASRAPLLKRAIEQARAAAAKAPDDIDILRLLGQAQLAIAESDDAALPEARSAFERVLAHDPEDLQSLASLGQIYLAVGEAGKAADVLTVASRLRPGAPALSAMLLDALLKSERTAEAAALLRRNLEGDGSDLQSRTTLADLLSDAGDHRGAATLLRGALGEQRTSSDVRRRLAIEEYRNGALEAALAEIDPLLAAEPTYTGGRYLRGVLLSALARNAEAEKEFAELLQKTPESVDFTLNLARVIERQGRRVEANAFLRETLRRLEADAKATAAAPDDAARLRIALALSAGRAKDWAAVQSTLAPMLSAPTGGELRDEAIFIAADALVETQRGDEALTLLGSRPEAPFAAKRCELLQRLQRTTAAGECFERLTELPGGDGLLEAADARQRLDDFAGSIPLLERARARVAEPTEVDYRLASAYERTGRRQPALGLLRGILARRPDYAPALNYLGYMLADQGESLQEALGFAERAVELDPGNGAYVDSLGWAHFQLRQLDQARLYLERAAGLVPDDATIREHLGDLYAAAGDTQKARAVYRQALDLGGENAAAVERKLRGLPGGS